MRGGFRNDEQNHSTSMAIMQLLLGLGLVLLSESYLWVQQIIESCLYMNVTICVKYAMSNGGRAIAGAP